MELLVDPNDSTNRQDYIGDHFFISGNFYIADIEYLKKNKGFFSQETRFFETNNIYSVDIDNQEDFNYAKYCLEMINKSKINFFHCDYDFHQSSFGTIHYVHF